MKTKVMATLLAMIISQSACASSVKLKVHVHNEEGAPVANAKVKAAFNDRSGNTEFLPSMKDQTDEEGNASVSGRDDFYTPVWVEKEGYYESYWETLVDKPETHDFSILLRAKLNPIPMYAKTTVLNANDKQGRVNGKQFGYDFMVGDFVPPHGNGSTSDLLITHTYQKKDTWNYSFDILVEFSNSEDGLIPFFFDENFKNSKFRSVYTSPYENYLDKWPLHMVRNGAGIPATGNMDKSRNYYFRVRTKLNEKGEVESAHYGKIYGEFPGISYYLNPTPNDRNLEFDPKQNLLKNLKPQEQVRQP